jgi:3-hydroxyacyl-CoA dehydrogenase
MTSGEALASDAISTGEPSLVRFERDDDILVAIIDNPPVNAGSWGVRKGLAGAMAAATEDQSISAVVILGHGKTFISGSDIREFGQPLREPLVPQVIAAIETCPKPVVAAIHGSGLGGGYEIALACDFRIAARTAVVGLPEVRLGIIPGAGGTQRLPRLTGMSRAIDLITSSRRVPAPEALKLGMIDAVSEGDLRDDAIAAARSLRGRKIRIRDKTISEEPEDLIRAAQAAARKSAKGLSSVDVALDMLSKTAHMNFDAALACERAAFDTLRTSEQATALRHVFFAERLAMQVPGIEGVKPRDIRRVGILGAGTMGTGIAMAFLDGGYDVIMLDRTQEALSAGHDRIRTTYEKSIAAGRIDELRAASLMAHLNCTTEMERLATCDLLLEAVFEDYDVKLPVMEQLAALARPDAVIASNTSYLDLDRLADQTGRAADVVGLHFFSPAHLMKLLEVVRGAKTSPETLATALVVAKRLKKTAVVAGVGEGFIGNRIYASYRRQCEFMVEEGAAPEDIDRALEGFGFAMGPFAVSDLSGLDIAWKMRQRLAATRDPQERYVTIADRLCEAGRLGRKTGAGWYDYTTSSRGKNDPQTLSIIAKCRLESERPQRNFSPEQIVQRALAAIVNEAALLLGEGIAQRASDIDLAFVYGYGFPAYRGGPAYWASRMRPEDLETAMDDLAEATGFGFRRGDLGLVVSS